MKRAAIVIFGALIGAASALAIIGSRLHWCDASLPFDPGPEWKCANWNDATLESTRHAGDEIAEALTLFRHTHGAFPGALDELISPEFPAIPEPAAGRGGWNYETDEMRCCFRLGVSGYRDCSCLNLDIAKNGDWREHDAAP
jgi:hypothetical protein